MITDAARQTLFALIGNGYLGGVQDLSGGAISDDAGTTTVEGASSSGGGNF